MVKKFNLMKNLTIRKKLWMTGGVIFGVMGLFTYNTLVSTNLLLDAFKNNEYINQISDKASQIKENVLSIDQNMSYLVLANTDEDNEDFHNTIKKSIEQINTNIAYIENNSLPEEATALNVFKNFVSEIEKEYNNISKLISSNDFDTAKKQLFDTNTNYYKAYESSKNLIDEYNTTMDEAKLVFKQKEEDVVDSVLRNTFILIILASIVLYLIFRRLYKDIAKPIEKIKDACNEMSNGNFNVDISSDENDELGLLSNDIQSMTNNISLIINDIVRILEELANGNFNVSPESNYVGDFELIEKSINKIVTDLSETIYTIKTSSHEVSGIANQMATSATMLAQGATEQASAVEEFSGTINGIRDMAMNTVSHTQRVNEVAQTSGQLVAKGNIEMGKLVEAMNNIQHSSNEINKIIKTIDEIAFQTNILSLNASIESAKSGEAGRGFAVVAEEIRNLSIKTAEASKNSAELIRTALFTVDEGIAILQETEASLNEIKEKTTETIELVEVISSEASEQEQSISQIKTGIEQIAEVVQTNSAMSEETAGASEELNTQALLLSEMMEKFNLK